MRSEFKVGVLVRANAPCKRGPNNERPTIRSMPDPGGLLLKVSRYFGECFYECTTEEDGLSGTGGRRMLFHEDDLALASAFDEAEP